MKAGATAYTAQLAMEVFKLSGICNVFPLFKEACELRTSSWVGANNCGASKKHLFFFFKKALILITGPMKEQFAYVEVQESTTALTETTWYAVALCSVASIHHHCLTCAVCVTFD